MIPLSVVNQGVSTTIVDITGNSFNNLDLYDYFKDKMKREPRASENVLFITKSPTKITSTTTSKAALTLRTWPTGTGEVTLNNSATITGAGGKGGYGAALYRKDGTINRSLIPHNSTPGKINATRGEDGGPAIDNKSSTRLIVINSGYIYGGGGGGGGGGAYAIGYAINSNKAANVQWLSFAPNGDKLLPSIAGSGGGGGGAPYGGVSATTLSLQWLADTYSDMRSIIATTLNKGSALQRADNQIREGISVSSRSGLSVSFPIIKPQNFSFVDLNNRDYPELNLLASLLFSKLGIHSNRWCLFQFDITDANNKQYRRWMPAYDTIYDTKYITGDYSFFKSQQTTAWTGSGASNIPGLALLAQRRQQTGSETKGGLGGALSEEALIDGQHIYNTGFVGWKVNSSTGKTQLTNDSVNSIPGGNGGDLGKPGGAGVLSRIYYRGSSSGNAYRSFNLPHDTKMDILQPAAGGKAGLVKTGNVVITNSSGGVSLGS